jgi:alpha-2-macroglobulin
VVDLLPGGLEAENLNLVPTEQLAAIEIDGIKVSDARSELYPRTEEFRDDRYVVALNLREGKTMTYYVARAVSPGNFVVPPPMLEDMYRPELQAIGVSIPERIEVSGGVAR